MTEMKTEKSFFKKHMVALIIILAVTPIICILGFVAFRMVYLLNSGTIEDTNGPDDYSVVTITEEEIKNAVLSDCISFVSGQSHDGEQSNVEDDRLSDVDYNITSYFSKSVNGVLIANATNTNEDRLSLDIMTEVYSGNTQIFVFIEDTLYCEVDINKTQRVVLTGIANKTVYVKAACEDAEMGIKVERKIGD